MERPLPGASGRCSFVIAALARVEIGFERGLAVVSHATGLTRLDRIHRDGVRAGLHLEELFMACLAIELLAMNLVREHGWWHVLGSGSGCGSLEGDVAIFGGETS